MITCPPISEVKVTLEHHKSSHAGQVGVGGDSGKSAKNAKFQKSTSGGQSSIHGGREVVQGSVNSGVQDGVQGGVRGGVQGGVHGAIQDGVQGGVQNGVNKMPHGFSFDPAEGFKLDDPQHEVSKTAKLMLLMKQTLDR